LITTFFLCYLFAVSPPGKTLEFPGKTPLRLKVAVGPAHFENSRTSQFLNLLFDFHDRDSSGSLSQNEANRLFALPYPGNPDLEMNMALADANKDDSIDREEFQTYYRKRGFTFVQALIHPVDAERTRLSETLWKHLDLNADGTITSDEWQRAPRLLRQFDENENETLEARELLAMILPAKTELLVLPIQMSEAKPLATLHMDATSHAFTLTTDHRSLTWNNDQKRLLAPTCNILLQTNEWNNVPAFRAAKGFFLAQFTEALGNKNSLAKTVLDSDPALQALAGFFDAADHDGNGLLTAAELAAFLKLIEQGIACQTWLIIHDHGANLFDLLDRDGDGRLDANELRHATNRPSLIREDVPRSVQIRVVNELPAKRFGPVPLPARPATAPLPVKKNLEGPPWFQALDRNRDGFLSPTEFRGPPALFHQLDLNQDNRLSPTEAAQESKQKK
jgi:Ca2+-binding EF-hand superfamily protein